MIGSPEASGAIVVSLEEDKNVTIEDTKYYTTEEILAMKENTETSGDISTSKAIIMDPPVRETMFI